jgi:hypothetical protein
VQCRGSKLTLPDTGSDVDTVNSRYRLESINANIGGVHRVHEFDVRAEKEGKWRNGNDRGTQQKRRVRPIYVSMEIWRVFLSAKFMLTFRRGTPMVATLRGTRTSHKTPREPSNLLPFYA